MDDLCVSYFRDTTLVSVHPETPDDTSLSFQFINEEFPEDQGNQGIARRRTNVRRTRNPAD